MAETDTPKVEWTPEQQSEIDRLVNARLARERTAWERQHKGGSDEERAELERLRVEQKKREEAEAVKRGEYERLVQSAKDEAARKEQSWQKERTELFEDLKRDRCEGALINAAAEFGAYSPAQVAKLLSDSVKLDDKRQVIVLDDDGQAAYKGGAPLSVKERVKAFLDANPHLVKAANAAGGSGAKGGRTNAGDGGALKTEAEKLKAEIAEIQNQPGRSTDDMARLLKLQRRLKAATAA